MDAETVAIAGSQYLNRLVVAMLLAAGGPARVPGHLDTVLTVTRYQFGPPGAVAHPTRPILSLDRVVTPRVPRKSYEIGEKHPIGSMRERHQEQLCLGMRPQLPPA
jgi:hypothetical protein